MKINTFLESIPEIIHERGEEYYASDLVSHIGYEEPGTWTAIVEGTEDYEVEIVLENDNIVTWDCNCPYDHGDVCKHVVALLLAIKDQQKSPLIHLEPIEVTSPKSNDLAELFKNTNKKSIVSFLIKYAAQHPGFSQELECALLPVVKEKATIDYKKEVEKCFSIRNRELSYNRYGYSNQEEVIADKLNDLSNKADFLMKKGFLEDAIEIALSIMEEIASHYEEYEDYNGYLCGACQQAETVVEEVIQQCDSKELTTSIIDRLRPLVKNKNFENYSLADINKLLFDITLKSAGVNESIKVLDETLELEPDSFRTPSLVKTKLELLKNDGRMEEVKQVIDSYLYIPEIRKIKLEHLLASKEYGEAILLIDGGITEAEKKNHSGTVADWKDSKLDVYKQMGNTEKIISIARELFFNGRDAMKYYHLLKELIPSTQWVVYLDDLLARKKDFHYSSVHAQIYIEEGYWDRLFDWVLKHTGLNNKNDSASSYIEHLLPHFPEKIVEMYRSRLTSYAERNMGRDHYQFVARILKQMKSYPKGGQAVADLVNAFRRAYSNRRAMMEELKDL